MHSRRYFWFFAILLSVLGGSAVAGAENTAEKSWRFKVYLGDKEIGQHSFVESVTGGQRRIDIAARFDVKVLFFTAYQYRHSNTEIWQGDCLQSIDAQTEDDGDKLFVSGRVNDKGVQVTSHNGAQQLPGCINTFAYWDASILDSKQLLNSQTGELLPVEITKVGDEEIEVRGQKVMARRYHMTCQKFMIELWYSQDDQWLALQSTTAEGHVLNYRLQ